jgi:hypothetical protein
MRKALVGVLAAVVVVAMFVALWQYNRRDAPTPELRLTEVEGEVELARPSGPAEARRGTVLQPLDRVATGEGGHAILTLGRDTNIRVGPASSLAVVGVDETGVSLELENGALQATVRPESGAVRVGNRGRSVLATAGEFEVGVLGEVLQVSATRGGLSLSGIDATRLEEGQQATVLDRHADVGAIPEELLLAVVWPESTRTRATTASISGRTTPGARVAIRGAGFEVVVVAGADGEFTVADLPLSEGDSNPVEIEAVDALGRRAPVERGTLGIRDTRGPSFQGGVEYDPKGQAPPGGR